jgi:23S rRNA (adenine-N6)-dimethyltransferase
VPDRSEIDRRRRELGQNLLRDDRVAAKLVENERIEPDDSIVEIGAGRGAMTAHLARRARSVTAVEADPEFVKVLERRFRDDSHVTVVHADIRTFRWPAEPFRVIGNIPYGITTDILHALLDDLRLPLTRADLVMQFEVARKRADTRLRNKLTAMWAPWYSFELGERLAAEMFTPVPKVDGARLVIRRRADPLVEPSRQLLWNAFVERAFTRPASVRQAFRTIFTNRQLTIVAKRAGFDVNAALTSLDAEQWAALFTTMVELVPREKWPSAKRASARGKRAPRRKPASRSR